MRRISAVPPALCVALALACTAQSGPAPKPKPEAAGEEPTKPNEPVSKTMRLDAAAIAAEVQSTLDASADPCDNFYKYACGGWLTSTTRPPDKPRYGRGFGVVDEKNKAILREILEAAQTSEDPKEKQLGAFYHACMDEAAINAAGVTPIAELAGKIEKAKDLGDILERVGSMHRSVTAGGGGLFRVYVDADDKNPDVYIAKATQGGTGLPDRDFYLEDSEKMRSIRAQYEAHIARMLGFLGDAEADAKQRATAILAFETELARLARPRAEMRDPEKTYNKVGVTGFVALGEGLPWDRYFGGLGYGPDKIGEHLSVSVPEFFQGLPALLERTDLDTLKHYLRWHVIHATAEHLSAEIDAADFEMQKLLTGAERQSDRWERCVDWANHSVPELIGPAFVERQFAGDSKQIAVTMISAIEQAFEASLPELSWMDEVTRGRAITKAKAITNKIGYPDRWRNYSGLEFTGDDHMRNIFNALRFNFEYDANRVGGPVDRDEWHMPTAYVNAYYSASVNEIVFPAGILQPPYFSRDFPMAMNFGGIGMVMGHEITHGFDDGGRKYDEKGVLRPWWEDEAAQKFEAQAQCVDDLYSGIEVLPGVKLNGKLTLGENIADLGGIKEAYNAYKRWAAQSGGDAAPHVAGLTNDQLLFVGFAQGWCTLQSDESTLLRAKTDSHSPPEQRVNVPLSNFPSFWEAFSCAEGTPMHPAQTCQVW